MKGETALLNLEIAPAPDIEIPDTEKKKVTTSYGSTWDKKTYYKGYTAEILNGNILAVTVFDKKKGAEYRLYVSDFDYVGQDIKKSSIAHSTKSMRKLTQRYNHQYYYERQCVMVTDEENRAAAVKWLGSFETREPDVFKRICKYVDNIGAQKLQAKHERIRRSVNETMLQIRDIPKDFETWVDEVPFAENRYILYQYSRRKEKDGYCSHCQQYVKVSNPKHQGKGRCPNCKSKVTFLASGKMSGFSVYKTVIYMQKGKDREVIVRHFSAYRYFGRCGDRLYIDKSTNETFRHFYLADKYYEYDGYSGNWKQAYVNSGNKGYIYRKNIKKLLTESFSDFKHIKYIPFTAILKNIGPVYGKSFLNACRLYPQIEYFAKMKLWKLCEQLISNWDSELRKIKGNIFKELHLKKAEIKYIQDRNMGYDEIQLYNKCKKYDASLYPEIQEIHDHYSGGADDDVFELMKYMSFDKIKEYVNTQLSAYEEKHKSDWCRRSEKDLKSYILSDWCDYLENCIRLEWDISDTKVLKPRQLIERHDITVQLVKLKEDELEAREVQKRYYEYVYSLTYNDDDYSVVVPRNLTDLKYEGDELEHCVYTNYATRIAKGSSIILFIRKNDEFYKPYVTLELDPETYQKRQMRGYDNGIPCKEVQAFYDKYEKKVLNKLNEQRRAT